MRANLKSGGRIQCPREPVFFGSKGTCILRPAKALLPQTGKNRLRGDVCKKSRGGLQGRKNRKMPVWRRRRLICEQVIDNRGRKRSLGA